jgi:hypothetical protein
VTRLKPGKRAGLPAREATVVIRHDMHDIGKLPAFPAAAK